MGRNRGKQNGKAPAKAPAAGEPAGANLDQRTADVGQDGKGGAAIDAAAGDDAVRGAATAGDEGRAEGGSQGGEGGSGSDTAADEITFRTPLGIEGLARGVGAAARLFANTSSGGEVDIFTKDEAAIMVDFVRANPDAPVLAMFNHLTLTKRLPRTSPNRDDEFVLTLFHAAVKAAHQLEADRAAEEAAKQPAPPQGTWPGEQALKPAEPAFAPTGFSPR